MLKSETLMKVQSNMTIPNKNSHNTQYIKHLAVQYAPKSQLFLTTSWLFLTVGTFLHAVRRVSCVNQEDAAQNK